MSLALSASNFPRRAIHFDFHTMPGCEHLGQAFDPKKFVAALQQAKVEFINFFAKCNLGFCYFPSQVGTNYPGLTFDLMGQVIKACQAADIRVSVYFNAGLSHEEALRHREWCIVNQKGQVYEFDQMDHWFRKLCFNSGYRQHLLGMVKEVLQAYPVDGVIFDSMNVPPCYGIECIEAMQKLQMDPKNLLDAEVFAQQTKLSMQSDLEKLVQQYRPGIYRYYLGIEACHQPTHIELEVLPQGGWGYDYLPSRIRYIRTLGKPYSTMTGRFQRSWGDLGGLRPEAALFYDCVNSVANGGACSIGDHLHPSGALQPAVYDLIGKVYRRLAELDEWCDQAKPQVDMAILAPWLRPEAYRPSQHMELLAGASRMLLELGYQYDVIDGEAAFDHYKLLFLPDDARLHPSLAAKLTAYLQAGGALISSAWSGMHPDTDIFALPALAAMVETLGSETINYSFLHCHAEIADELPELGLTIYEPGIAMQGQPGSRCLAGLGKGYFNLGDWDFKHEYLYIPEKEMTSQAALLNSADGRVWHLAFPIALNYYKHAPIYCKTLLRNIIRKLLPQPLLQVKNLPSYGVATVTSQEQRRMIHLMCYVPEKRGQIMEIIEEASVAVDLEISLRLDGRCVERVYLAPSRQQLPFRQKDDYLKISLDKLIGYQLLVCDLK
ncbi:MAG: alpha-amylase family protein [Lentisphaeria bacterium]